MNANIFGTGIKKKRVVRKLVKTIFTGLQSIQKKYENQSSLSGLFHPVSKEKLHNFMKNVKSPPETLRSFSHTY